MYFQKIARELTCGSDDTGRISDFVRPEYILDDSADDEDHPLSAFNPDENEDTFQLKMPQQIENLVEQPLEQPLPEVDEQPMPVLDDDSEDVDGADDVEEVPEAELAESARLQNLDQPPALAAQPRKQTPIETAVTSKPRQSRNKVTKHGHTVPALPLSLMRRLANDAMPRIKGKKSKIGRDSLKAIEQATEWFFEQVGEDLEAYSNHARRKKRVTEDDMHMLMRRQRLIVPGHDLRALAEKYLPPDALLDLDLPDR